MKPGRYQIVVGVYDPETGKRLKVKSTGLPVHDHGVILPVDLTVR